MSACACLELTQASWQDQSSTHGSALSLFGCLCLLCPCLLARRRDEGDRSVTDISSALVAVAAWREYDIRPRGRIYPFLLRLPVVNDAKIDCSILHLSSLVFSFAFAAELCRSDLLSSPLFRPEESPRAELGLGKFGAWLS